MSPETEQIKLPNFIVIGAPKSGTTSLFYYLGQHPDIYLPVRKELHFFSYEELSKRNHGPGDAEIVGNLCATYEQYVAHYRDVKTERAIGEVSPSYLYYSASAERIYSMLGSIKIIAILRNPIDKAYSQYMHLKRDGREDLDFTHALREECRRQGMGWSDIWYYAK